MTTPNETSVAKRTRSATDYVHEGIDRAAEALHDTAENTAASAVKLADRADRGVGALRAKQEQARATTIEYAAHHPLRTLLISAGIGFVLAKLLNSSRA